MRRGIRLFPGVFRPKAQRRAPCQTGKIEQYQASLRKCAHTERANNKEDAQMPSFKKIAIAALGVVLTTGAGALAQDAIGKDEFQQRCAACHGMDGRGDGVVAGLFALPPKNLVGLSKANDGVFPRERVYNSIAGTHKIAGHGSSEMPLWGRYFTDEVRRKGIADPTPMQKAESDIVRGRILSLVYYIESIQAE